MQRDAQEKLVLRKQRTELFAEARPERRRSSPRRGALHFGLLLGLLPLGCGSGGTPGGGAGAGVGGSSTPAGGSGGGSVNPGGGTKGGGDSGMSGGVAGSISSGGASAASGTGTTPGGGGPSTGGSGGAAGGNTAPPGAGDDFVTGVNIDVHAEVKTVLVVTWTQSKASESTWLEFTFEDGNVMTSRPKPGTAGMHKDVVLGVPASTNVTVRIVNKQAGTDYKTRDYQDMTGALPKGIPTPTIVSYDAAKASPDRWMFGAVENSDGGCTSQACYYHTVFWVYIMDRKGRFVWYWADAASNTTPSFQRIARDGEYIWIEMRPFGGNATRRVRKMTLDWEFEEEIPVPGLSDCIDVTDDGGLLYDVQGGQLREMNAARAVRNIWSCQSHFGQGFQCYSNTINWNPADNTVLMSFPEERTVIQINRATGAVVGQYGAAPNSYAFSPSTWGFGYQHFPTITPQGTLLVSSHMPGYENTRMPVAGQHAFMEFTIDRANRRLVEKWIYNAGPEWAMFKGMALRLPNGNTLGNYGTGGAIREITPDKQTAWHVKFDVPTGNDFFNKMVGHNVLIDDLYALNGGPKR